MAKTKSMATISAAEASPLVTPADRERMIAERAYFRHIEKSGGSDSVEDWLAAEREIDRTLSSADRQQRSRAF